MTSKTLYLLRHAKAESGHANQEDHARHLTSQGLAQARALGQYMHHMGMIPDAILCSTATRTRETYTQIQEQMQTPISTEFVDKLYHASIKSTLNLIGTTQEQVHTLLLVGHNPGMHQLAAQLADTGHDALLEEATLHYPPCTLSIFTFDSAWRDIALHTGTIIHFLTPEDVAKSALSSVA